MAVTINASLTSGAIISSDTSGSLQLQTNSGTTALTIDTSQKVGIGTSTIYANVQIAGASNATVLKVSSTDQASGMLSLGDGGSSSNNVGVYRGQPHALSNGNWLNLGGYDGIAFTTGNNALGSQTEVMRIDTSGNLGLGVTPSTWSTGGGKTLQLTAGALTAYSTSNMQMVQNMYFNGGWIYSTSNYATIYNQSAGQHTWYNAPSGTAGNSVSLTQAMTLDNSGNLLINTTTLPSSSGAGVQIYNNSGQAGRLNIGKGTSGLFNAIANYYSGTYVGGVNYDNTSTSFPTSSDARLKKDIVDASSASAKIEQIRIVSHGWKHDDAVVEYGVVAQELVNVAPQAVAVGDTGEEITTTWGVDYSKLVPMLIKAIQELSAELNALKLKVGA